MLTCVSVTSGTVASTYEQAEREIFSIEGYSPLRRRNMCPLMPLISVIYVSTTRCSLMRRGPAAGLDFENCLVPRYLNSIVDSCEAPKHQVPTIASIAFRRL